MIRTEELEREIRKDVFEFFSDQCGIDMEKLNDETNIIEDMDGDSLMILQMLEGWKKKYALDIEFRKIGKYLTKNPVNTLGSTVQLAYSLILDGEGFSAELE